MTTNDELIAQINYLKSKNNILQNSLNHLTATSVRHKPSWFDKALRMHQEENMSYRQIAEELGQKENTVMRRFNRYALKLERY